MRVNVVILLCCSIVPLSIHAAEDADALYKKGVELLQKVVAGNDAELISAADCFAKASANYESAGNTEGAQLANSCLYWSKKRMTLKQAGEFASREAGSAEAQKTIQVVETKVESDQSAAYFERAEKFMKAHPDDNLPIAIRYFEVADRFVGTPLSIKAQELSLSAMQKFRVSPFGAPKTVTDDEALKIPAVAKATATFESFVVKAKERYSKELDAVHKSIQATGNLDALKQVETEQKFLPSTNPCRGAANRTGRRQNRSAICGKSVPREEN